MHLHHRLGDIDVATTLLHRLAVEGRKAMFVARIVLGDALDGRLHQATPIATKDTHLLDHHRRGVELHLQLASLQHHLRRKLQVVVAQVSKVQPIAHLIGREFQHETTVGVAHRADVRADNRDVYIVERGVACRIAHRPYHRTQRVGRLVCQHRVARKHHSQQEDHSIEKASHSHLFLRFVGTPSMGKRATLDKDSIFSLNSNKKRAKSHRWLRPFLRF